MNGLQRTFFAVACTAVLFIAWATVFSIKSDVEKQEELMAQADALLQDEIYITAVPLLQQAAALRGQYTDVAEEKLKEVYLILDSPQSYTALLNAQMAREGATAEVFTEAIDYYLAQDDLSEALSILRAGIQKTGDAKLKEVYETERYAFRLGGSTYEDLTTVNSGALKVKNEGLWGIATYKGEIVIPCEYESLSTFSGDRTIAKTGNIVEAINTGNYRIALLKDEEPIQDIGNYENDRIPLKKADKWIWVTGKFQENQTQFDATGMFSNGYAAVEQGGKWGVIDTSINPVIPLQYDGVVMDVLGRCYAQDVVFMRQGADVLLFAKDKSGAMIDTGVRFEDAKPFMDGLAAVKQNGKWGFADTTGQIKIDAQFDDAISFSYDLAGVKVGDSWGYISLYGKLAIEPQFLEVCNFTGGTAPVRTENGWQFINLIEYD